MMHNRLDIFQRKKNFKGGRDVGALADFFPKKILLT
jgi:hypothetical protein